MNQSQQENWQFEAISQILIAMAENKSIQNILVFKGALILYKRLQSPRKSLDIDSNMVTNFIKKYPYKEQQISILKKRLERSITDHFEHQDPVRFELNKIKIDPSPRTTHPFGWDGYSITISLLDHENSGVRGLPSLSIDIAAPESYSKHSYSELKIGKSKIRAYTLERIAGEKARAFLTSLCAYRDKVGKREKAIRVKDLYDLALIARIKSISNKTFWRMAGYEFKISCETRFVDCSGPETFQEEWQLTEKHYDMSPIIPKDISFKKVEKSILVISKYWKKIGIIPFFFPLPTNKHKHEE